MIGDRGRGLQRARTGKNRTVRSPRSWGCLASPRRPPTIQDDRDTRRRGGLACVILAILAATSLVVAALAATGATAAPGKKFPEVISLPNGWLPEGIAIGKEQRSTRLARERRHLPR